MLPVTAAVFYQRGKPGRQTFVKAGNGIGREVLEIPDVDNGLEHGPQSPDIGTVQMADLQEQDFLFICSGIRVRMGKHGVSPGVD
jgi:hypothetical protein